MICYTLGLFVSIEIWVSNDERIEGYPGYARRLVGLIIAGFFITAAVAALILGILSSFLPPTFIQLCDEKMGFEDALSTCPFPTISIFSYTASVCLILISFQKKNLGYLACCTLVAAVPMIGFGLYSYDLGAPVVDILSGYAFGGIMGWVFLVKLRESVFPDLPL